MRNNEPSWNNNERSWQISMITDLNIELRNMGLLIARIGGEITINAADDRNRFPDAILYGDDNQTQILQGWELKLPDTSITDSDFIENAKNKAVLLGLNSFFLWNFRYGVLYVKKDGDFQILKQWNETWNIQTRQDVEDYKSQWLPVIKNILVKINEYLITGEIQGVSLLSSLSDNIIVSLVNSNKSIVADELKHKNRRNSRIHAHISEWWRNIKDEYRFNKEIEGIEYQEYSKAILINWIIRILFAHCIKSFFNVAREIDKLDDTTEISTANEIFEKITSSCDFYSVFKSIKFNDFLPSKTWKDLIEFSIFLKNNPSFLGTHGEISQSLIHGILEKTVSTTKRVLNGQYATPEVLANLITQITIHDWTGNTLDPCCGTGTIARAIQKNKISKIEDIQKALNTTWAMDKFTVPLQLSNIGLTSFNTIHIPNRIFQKNIFELKTNQSIKIINPDTGEQLNLRFPCMDNIISNLPFIEFENIPASDRKFIKDISNEIKQKCDISIDKRSDYYFYIVFMLYKLLNDYGRIGVITSNSWLGTKTGGTFFKALRFYYNIEQIHISGSKRWFDNADIVTVLTVLSKRPQIEVPDKNNQTAFYVWKKSLNELESDEECQSIIVDSALLDQEIDKDVITKRNYTSQQIDEYLDLKLSLSSLFHDVEWLLSIREKLTKISDVFNVIRGERTGCNDLFYPKEGEHNIESCYLKDLLKTSQSVDSLIAKPDRNAFCCSKTIKELEALGHTGAIAWIKRFESLPNGVGQPLPTVLKLKNPNLMWYEMKVSNSNTAELVLSMNPDERLFYARFDEPTFIDQRLIGFKTKTGYKDIELYHALLNSIVGMFYIEATGFGRALGALDINKDNLGDSFMLNPALLSKRSRNAIIKAFKPLLHRSIMSTEDELNSSDRDHFDHVVLSSYGIEAYHDRIKQTLIEKQQLRQKQRLRRNNCE